MLDLNDLLAAIKKAAVEAVEAGNPTALVYGRVISTSPLKINIEQKMTLTSAQLVLARNVTDFTVDMTVAHETDSALNINTRHTHPYSGNTNIYSGNTEKSGLVDIHDHEYSHMHSYGGTTNESNSYHELNHRHEYAGRKQFTVHNALAVGEEVVMIRMQGGQKFLVMDRVVGV